MHASVSLQLIYASPYQLVLQVGVAFSVHKQQSQGPPGLMDKASDLKSEDCGLKSRRGWGQSHWMCRPENPPGDAYITQARIAPSFA